MRELKAIAEELARRQRIDVRYDDGELAIPIEKEMIFVSADEEHRRVVVWTDLGRCGEHDLLTIAAASLAYNERFGFERGATIGVSRDADRTIIGRSVEPVRLDAPWLLGEARRLYAELEHARSFFQDRLREMRGGGGVRESSLSHQKDDYIRA